MHVEPTGVLHLNPTGVLHIDGFVTVREAFLGMEPHTDFFQWLFSGRALPVGNPPEVTPVGVSPYRGNRAREARINIHPLRLQPEVERGVVLY